MRIPSSRFGDMPKGAASSMAPGVVSSFGMVSGSKTLTWGRGLFDGLLSDSKFLSRDIHLERAKKILDQAGITLETAKEHLDGYRPVLFTGFGNPNPTPEFSGILTFAYGFCAPFQKIDKDHFPVSLGISTDIYQDDLLNVMGSGVTSWSRDWRREIPIFIWHLSRMIQDQPDTGLDFYAYSKGGYQALAIKMMAKICSTQGELPNQIRQIFGLENVATYKMAKDVFGHIEKFKSRLIWIAVPPEGVTAEVLDSFLLGRPMSLVFSREAVTSLRRDSVLETYRMLLDGMGAEHSDIFDAGIVDGAVFGDLNLKPAGFYDGLSHTPPHILPGDGVLWRSVNRYLRQVTPNQGDGVATFDDSILQRIGQDRVSIVPGVGHMAMFALGQVAVEAVRLILLTSQRDKNPF